MKRVALALAAATLIAGCGIRAEPSVDQVLDVVNANGISGARVVSGASRRHCDRYDWYAFSFTGTSAAGYPVAGYACVNSKGDTSLKVTVQ